MDVPFQFDSDEVAVPRGGGLLVRIPGAIRSKRRLLRQYVIQLHLPAYFGWNWDALDECLRDLSWLSGNPQVTIVHDSIPLEANSQAQRDYLGLLRDVCATSSQPTRLQVVFPIRCRPDIEQLLQ